MRIVFLGYHDFGFEALDTLLDGGDEVVRVVTHRDDPKENIYFRSVAKRAEEAGIPWETRESQPTGRLPQILQRIEPDLIVSAYYRRMIPARWLELARFGGVNLHGSLLPKYRGRCPLNWVLIHDEKRTGVTLHRMTAEVDAGDILAARAVDIAPRETAGSLAGKLVGEVRPLLEEVLPRLRQGDLRGTPQVSTEASTFGGRRPEDGRIDWKRTAREVDCLVRAVTRPYPGAWTEVAGRRLLVWVGQEVPETEACGLSRPGLVLAKDGGQFTVQCGTGAYRIEEFEWPDGEISASGVAEGIVLGDGPVLIG